MIHSMAVSATAHGHTTATVVSTLLSIARSIILTSDMAMAQDTVMVATTATVIQATALVAMQAEMFPMDVVQIAVAM